MSEHDAFVVDTRRTKGNRRATPARPRPRDEAPTQAAPESPGSRRKRAQPSRETQANTPRPVQPDAGQTRGRGNSRPRPQDPAGESAQAIPTRSTRPEDERTRPAVRRIRSSEGDVYVGGPGIGGPGGRGPGGARGAGGAGKAQPGDGADPDKAAPARRRRLGRRGKKIVAGVLVFLLLWVGGLIWAGTSAWNKVTKVDAIPSDHLADSGSGTNTLIVGSDGRAGLSTAQRKALGTGQADGQRTDSIMVLHTGGPKPTLMSIPRDSYVSIPGHGKNKVNASFSIGGPQLLIKTLEQNTGIHIDHYMEIGFGGFASVVDTLGGVHICVARDMDDHKAHINLKKGCQTLNGPNALGYVRARYSDPEGDLGRAKRQRQFLGALMKKVSSPTNLLVPWKLKGLGESGAQGLSVDKGMSMLQALSTMWTLKGFSSNSGNSVVVPVGEANLATPVGDAVAWDPEKSAALFKAIRDNGDTSPYVTKTSSTSPSDPATSPSAG